jgi:hypothetical protein
MRTEDGDETFPGSLVERRIRTAMERGEFDDLPGAGEPIADLDVSYDPDWWAKKWIRRERLLDAARKLDRHRCREVSRARLDPDRRAARRRLDEIDGAIAALNEELAPEDRLDRVDVDSVLREVWNRP